MTRLSGAVLVSAGIAVGTAEAQTARTLPKFYVWAAGTPTEVTPTSVAPLRPIVRHYDAPNDQGDFPTPRQMALRPRLPTPDPPP